MFAQLLVVGYLAKSSVYCCKLASSKIVLGNIKFVKNKELSFDQKGKVTLTVVSFGCVTTRFA